MDHTAALIDAVSQHWLNKGAASVGDSDTRARILLHAKAASRKRWNKRAWWFKQTKATVTIGAVTGQGDLPDNFGSFGKDGFIVNPASRTGPLTWLPPNQLLKLFRTDTATHIRPTHYTLYGRELGGAEVIGGLQVYRAPPVNVELSVYYDQKGPVLLDADDETSMLWLWPEDFHDSVLLPDIIGRLMVDEGDTRSLEMTQAADRADAELWAEHQQGRQQPARSPRYGRGVFR